MSNLDKCDELLGRFTEEQLAGVRDMLEVLAEDPTNELLTVPEDGFNVVQRARASIDYPLVTAIDHLFRLIILNGELPWEDDEDIPNAVTIKVLEDAEKGIGVSAPYDSVDDLMEDLS